MTPRSPTFMSVRPAITTGTANLFSSLLAEQVECLPSVRQRAGAAPVRHGREGPAVDRQQRLVPEPRRQPDVLAPHHRACRDRRVRQLGPPVAGPGGQADPPLELVLDVDHGARPDGGGDLVVHALGDAAVDRQRVAQHREPDSDGERDRDGLAGTGPGPLHRQPARAAGAGASAAPAGDEPQQPQDDHGDHGGQQDREDDGQRGGGPGSGAGVDHGEAAQPGRDDQDRLPGDAAPLGVHAPGRPSLDQPGRRGRTEAEQDEGGDAGDDRPADRLGDRPVLQPARRPHRADAHPGDDPACDGADGDRQQGLGDGEPARLARAHAETRHEVELAAAAAAQQYAGRAHDHQTQNDPGRDERAGLVLGRLGGRLEAVDDVGQAGVDLQVVRQRLRREGGRRQPAGVVEGHLGEPRHRPGGGDRLLRGHAGLPVHVRGPQRDVADLPDQPREGRLVRDHDRGAGRGTVGVPRQVPSSRPAGSRPQQRAAPSPACG